MCMQKVPTIKPTNSVDEVGKNCCEKFNDDEVPIQFKATIEQ